MTSVLSTVLPVANLHREPHAASELNTQARLGDVAEVVGRRAGWVQVRLLRTRETGWALAGALAPVRSALRPRPVAVVQSLFCNVHAGPSVRAPLLMTVPLGGRVGRLGLARTDRGGAPWARVSLPGGRTAWALDGDLSSGGHAWRWTTPAQLRAGLVRESLRLLGLPYRWGGTTPFGLDCSGLVQLVYGLHGLALPHNARRQATDPRMCPVSRRAVQSGDLLFFAKFTHVGMAISNREFIHATTWGRPGVQVSRTDDRHWRSRLDSMARPGLT